MTYETIVPELTVADVERSIEFYSTVLSFTVTAKAPEHGVPTWAEIASGSIRMMLQRRAEMIMEMPILSSRDLGGTMILVLQVSSADAKTFAHALPKNVKVALPLRETEYGTVEIGVFDPDSYVVLIAGR